MVAVRIIESDEIDLLLHLDGQLESTSSALWLPSDAASARDLLSILAEQWQDQVWGAVNSWLGIAGQPPGDFARFGQLAAAVVASSSFATPRGRAARVQWAVVDPLAAELHEYVTHVRVSGGTACLLLAPAGSDSRAWYAPSALLVPRLLLRLEGLGDRAHYETDCAMVVNLIAAVTRAGCALVVPLDLHPWGGYVVLGAGEFLAQLHALLPQDIPIVAGVTPREVSALAGGLAL